MEKELWVAGTGLIGNKVSALAEEKGIEVAKTAKSESEDPTGRSEILDITDFEAVKKYFWDHHFKTVIIAAGIALPAAAQKNPELALLVNAVGPQNIGRAILSLPVNSRPSVVFMGSALQYQEKEGAISEDTPFVIKGNAYVESKIKMVEFVRDLVSKGLDAKVAMIFNATGPQQGTDYFSPSMADQAAKINLGLQDKIIWFRYVDHARDFSHVDDTAMGIFLSLQGKSGDLINISSGYGTKLQTFIDILKEMSGVPGIENKIYPEFIDQKPKIIATWGNNSRLRALGFIPKKNIRDICQDLFEERLRVNREVK